MFSQQYPTPTAALIAVTKQQLRETRDTEFFFACRLVAEYWRRIPEHARTIDFDDLAIAEQHGDAKEYERIKATYCQHIRNFLHGRTRFPFDLVDAWLAALLEPHRTKAHQALDQWAGVFRFRLPMPDGGIAADTDVIARHLSCSADLQKILGVMIANGGEFCPDDASHLQDAERAWDALIQAAVEGKAHTRARVLREVH